jgi:hypothetical protein
MTSSRISSRSACIRAASTRRRACHRRSGPFASSFHATWPSQAGDVAADLLVAGAKGGPKLGGRLGLVGRYRK